VKFARASQFVEAVTEHDFEAAEEFLDPGVETVTPRGTRGHARRRAALVDSSSNVKVRLDVPYARC
jgi:hypothetical protein